MEWLSSCCRHSLLIFLLLPPVLVAASPPPPVVKFERAEILLSGHRIKVEVAQTEEQTARGLMYRQKLPPDEGMLFIFSNESTQSFWMKNTFIDLSIAYFDKSRTLVDIQEMQKASVIQRDFPTYPSKKPAQYALEMNKNWFQKKKIKLGSRFEFVKKPKSSP